MEEEEPRMLYHEIQESKICAVHCVNTVLQGPFFTELHLAELASDLDRRERQVGAVETEELLSFDLVGSSNVSMHGDFSIQVLQKALDIWGLEVIPWDSPLAESAWVDPHLEVAYICHLEDHWFTIRKVNGDWFNFDSLYAAPQYLSNFCLSAYLDTLKGLGWSVFLVRGNFPKECPVSSSDSLDDFGQWLTPEDVARISSEVSTQSGKTLQSLDPFPVAVMKLVSNREEEDLNAAIALSLKLTDECFPSHEVGTRKTRAITNSMSHEAKQELSAAIRLSLKDNSATPGSRETEQKDDQPKNERE